MVIIKLKIFLKPKYKNITGYPTYKTDPYITGCKTDLGANECYNTYYGAYWGA